ncbi:hypothetical protein [Streptomyces sp. S.PNR 29]|uniref:hypothetical protein n=1 Tax=Streptomyces sp. S.PNR 29 TaxID=2973805 RepID=UPI0025B02E19|nr:hypothetical protein [Streptomyces sp. S.PNR 29]MDN0198735.1 hypothetical protein [Streptomyces sp. S.PNR 29]
MRTRFDEVAVTVTAGRDAACAVDLSVAGERVRAVLHRGLGPPEAADDDMVAGEAAFLQAEAQAVWWSALALWPGPVSNRASPDGFVPYIDPLAAARLPGVTLPPSSIGGLLHTPRPGERRNVHRVRDGMFLGHGSAATSRGEGEILRFTCFDPDRTRHVLLAGDDVFDLSEPTGALAAVHRARLAPMVDRLRSLGATFCLLVIQPEGEGFRLLDVSCHPVHHQFAPLRRQVFGSLLRWLLAGPP